jgi:hypothetical protein
MPDPSAREDVDVDAALGAYRTGLPVVTEQERTLSPADRR